MGRLPLPLERRWYVRTARMNVRLVIDEQGNFEETCYYARYQHPDALPLPHIGELARCLAEYGVGTYTWFDVVAGWLDSSFWYFAYVPAGFQESVRRGKIHSSFLDE